MLCDFSEWLKKLWLQWNKLVHRTHRISVQIICFLSCSMSVEITLKKLAFPNSCRVTTCMHSAYFYLLRELFCQGAESKWCCYFVVDCDSDKPLSFIKAGYFLSSGELSPSQGISCLFDMYMRLVWNKMDPFAVTLFSSLWKGILRRGKSICWG